MTVSEAQTPLRASRRLRRIGWGLADQSLSSLSNFGALVVAGRLTDTASFGVFSALYGLYIILLGSVRGLVGDSFVIARARTADDSALKDAVAFSVLLGVAVGTLTGGVGLVLLAIFNSELARATICLALVLPGLLVHEALRLTSFGSFRPQRAMTLDLAWVAIMLASASALVNGQGTYSAVWALAWWGGSGTIAGLAGLCWTRARSGVGSSRMWWRMSSGKGLRFTLDAFAERASAQVPFITVALIGGAALGGVVRGASLLRGPMTILIVALPLSVVPSMARAANQQDMTRVSRSAALISVTLVIGSALWFGPIFLIPDLGRRLYGPLWTGAAPLLVWVFLRQVTAASTAGPLAALRSMGHASRTSRIRLAELGLALALSALGCVTDGARGVYVGLLTASAVASISAHLSFRSLRRAPVVARASPLGEQ